MITSYIHGCRAFLSSKKGWKEVKVQHEILLLNKFLASNAQPTTRHFTGPTRPDFHHEMPDRIGEYICFTETERQVGNSQEKTLLLKKLASPWPGC